MNPFYLQIFLFTNHISKHSYMYTNYSLVYTPYCLILGGNLLSVSRLYIVVSLSSLPPILLISTCLFVDREAAGILIVASLSSLPPILLIATCLFVDREAAGILTAVFILIKMMAVWSTEKWTQQD